MCSKDAPDVAGNRGPLASCVPLLVVCRSALVTTKRNHEYGPLPRPRAAELGILFLLRNVPR